MTNFQKGGKKEYKIIKREGYDLRKPTKERMAIRSAGSHSPVDVVLIDMVERTIRFVQCKPNSMSENKRQALREENNLLNGSFMARFEVI